MRLGVGSSKGGVGKTTLSINLAAALSKKGRVVIIDADPQRSSTHWKEIAGDSTPVEVWSFNEDEDIGLIQSQYDHCVIDCPPSMEAVETQRAMGSSDCFVIPVLPSPLDLWATVSAKHYVDQAKVVNPKLITTLLVNQLEPRTRLSAQVLDALEHLSLDCLDVSIRRRMAFRQMVLQGKSVFEGGKVNKPAADEIQAVLRALTEKLNG